ncbi:MAG TPA: FAD-dependent oxidoreductase, partial [Tianweitania sediminis]|nr:FAD-dependent oxidoreductase [Tianweitania sediminis]
MITNVPAPDLPIATDTTCCIAGGGPAGLMLGLLLARAGVPVVVLEKHRDFLRDFRGDTLHPSTLEVMEELGLGEALLSLPHQKLERVGAQFGDRHVPVADFRQLPVRHPFIALMPQWDFLSFLAAEASRHPHFQLNMDCEAVDLLRQNDRIVGVRAQTATGAVEIKADLVVAADGRSSKLREKAGLDSTPLGAPIDVFWFRVGRAPTESADTAGQFASGQVLVRINRGDYWQCGYVIKKGAADRIRKAGIEQFRDRLQPLFPAGTDLQEDIRSWDDIKLLTVAVDRLERWYRPGFLAI